jgi:molecular chaperone GrpE
MTDAPVDQNPENSDDAGAGDFQVSDKRKIDPTTGEVRGANVMSDEEVNARIQGLDFEPKRPISEPPAAGGAAAPSGATGPGAAPGARGSTLSDPALAAAKAEAAGYLDDLQRERASYTNYRNRALRDQEAAKISGREEVLKSLLPALDQITRAKEHGDITGPMENITNQIESALAKFGVVQFGAVGEPFDPNVHEALMHRNDESAETDTIETVLEPGYKIGEKLTRPARVAVVGPQ